MDGGWSRWSPWSLCDKRCGGGRSIRTRSCSSPPPKNGGKKCQGEKNQVKSCNTKPCGEAEPTYSPKDRPPPPCANRNQHVRWYMVYFTISQKRKDAHQARNLYHVPSSVYRGVQTSSRASSARKMESVKLAVAVLKVKKLLSFIILARCFTMGCRPSSVSPQKHSCHYANCRLAG